jgi:hypothetical protein
VILAVRIRDPEVAVIVIGYVLTGVEGRILTVAAADLVESACATAPTVTDAGVGTDGGAV